MPSAQATAENISKLKAKLRELFQLDRGDLDFGLYRIMAHKSAEVGAFLENDLLPQVTQSLGDIAASDSGAAQKALDEGIAQARALGGIDPEQTNVVKEARARLAAAKTDEQIEADTYNHLCKFFSRYYDEGDFMSMRRYKAGGRDAYSIPYNGEEVKLHWANADQYYIKTTENYASYIFIVGDGARVRFEVAAADNEKDNIKEANGKQRYFVPSKNFIAESDGALVVRFDHRPLTEGEKTKHPQNGVKRQASINADAEQRLHTELTSGWLDLLCAPCPTESDPERTLLGKHIAAYTAKNSFDYFIHKDLGGFLRRELDAYLKGEVLSIDNLTLADDPMMFVRGLAQLKALKLVGEKIIDFLAQLENFQKQLWLKKKFVLETQYCVTLDRVPEALYPAVAKNKAQRDEWVALFAIDQLNGERTDAPTAYSKPLKPAFLKENPHLVLDTKHFDQAFTDQLLAALSDAGGIEDSMNGLLVHGENFHGLNLLQERYQGEVKCVYIDPPYNTDQSKIMYKNDYEHSCWLSLMANGYSLVKSFARNDSVVMTAIDDYELSRLCELIKVYFSECNKHLIIVNHHPQGAGMGGAFLSRTHEYMVIAAFPKSSPLKGRRIEESIERRSFRRAGQGENNFRGDFSNSFFAVLVDPDGQVVGLEEPPEGNDYPTGNTKDGYRRIYPIGEDGSERVWRHAYGTTQKLVSQGELECTPKFVIRLIIDHGEDRRAALFSNWTDARYNAGTQGADWLEKLFGDSGVFLYPKSLYTVQDAVESCTRADEGESVLDYFAGSGTTGHAVINLNREDGGNRKYILVEIGKHFDDVLLPRMKKVVYSANWKNGKPDGGGGVSQLFKYVRIESYEDSLDSLAVTSRKNLLPAENQAMAEDYQLRYALGEETADNASLVGRDFIDPFNYALSVVRDGVRGDVKVDLAETFNFLLGLRIKGRRRLDGVLAIAGATRNGENCLVLWRDMNTMNAAKLDKWFGKHRKTFGDDLNTIYVNGDHTLNALQKPADKWEAVTTEPVFRRLMFSGAE